MSNLFGSLFGKSKSTEKPTEPTGKEYVKGQQPPDKDGKPFPQEQQKIVLSEEELVVGKRAVDAGAIGVQKKIETQTTSIPVTLQREDVTVERRPITDRDSISSLTKDNLTIGAQPQICATTMAEQAVVQKEVVPREEVRLSKETVAQDATVQANLRKERADINKDLNTNIPSVSYEHGSATAQGTSKGGGSTSSGIYDTEGRVVAHEERLNIDKRSVAAGSVNVRKSVDIVPEQAVVSLDHDEVRIDRKPLLDGKAIPGSLSTATEGTVFIPLQREDVVAGTRVVPKEEIILKKDVKEEHANVTEKLHREVLDVSAVGGTTIIPTDTSSATYSQSAATSSATSNTTVPGYTAASITTNTPAVTAATTTASGTVPSWIVMTPK